MNERSRFTVIFSAPALPYSQILEFLAPELGRLFGGASCHPVSGIWSADASKSRNEYQPGQIENGIKMMISVLPERTESSYQEIQDLVRLVARKFDLNLQHVHVELETVEAKHF